MTLENNLKELVPGYFLNPNGDLPLHVGIDEEIQTSQLGDGSKKVHQRNVHQVETDGFSLEGTGRQLFGLALSLVRRSQPAQGANRQTEQGG